MQSSGVRLVLEWIEYLLLVIALCVAIDPSAGAAQVLPGPASPGRIEQRFKIPRAPKATPEIVIPSPKAPMPPAEARKLHFTLRAVILQDSTVYKPAELRPLYQSLLGKRVSLARVFALRDALTAKYRRDGYILSQVIVPPQKIRHGVVHLQAIEGYVAHVHILGNAHDRRGLIAAMGARIKQSRPLRINVLERYVLLMHDLPGDTVRTILRPAKNVPGAADLDVVVTHQTVTGYAELDNHGSKAIGPVQALLGLDFNSIFGLDGHTGLELATVNPTHELEYVALRHDDTLTPEGLRLHLAAIYSRSRPEGALVDLNPLGNSTIFRAGIDYPLIRSLSRTLRVGIALTSVDNRVKLLGTQYSDDKVRYVSLTASYDAADTLLGDSRPASTLVTAELSKGLDILGATPTGSPDLSRANGHSNFTRLNAEAIRNQAVAGRFSLGLAAEMQLASAPLLSAEQFGIGGDRFGRGYEPSEILGDEGLAGSIEARYDLPTASTTLTSAQLYFFYDVGKVWNIDPVAGELKSQSLASAGPGIRFNAFHQIWVDFELAKPLTRDIASRGNRHVRPLLSILARF